MTTIIIGTVYEKLDKIINPNARFKKKFQHDYLLEFGFIVFDKKIIHSASYVVYNILSDKDIQKIKVKYGIGDLVMKYKGITHVECLHILLETLIKYDVKKIIIDDKITFTKFISYKTQYALIDYINSIDIIELETNNTKNFMVIDKIKHIYYSLNSILFQTSKK